MADTPPSSQLWCCPSNGRAARTPTPLHGDSCLHAVFVCDLHACHGLEGESVCYLACAGNGHSEPCRSPKRTSEYSFAPLLARVCTDDLQTLPCTRRMHGSIARRVTQVAAAQTLRAALWAPSIARS